MIHDDSSNPTNHLVCAGILIWKRKHKRVTHMISKWERMGRILKHHQTMNA